MAEPTSCIFCRDVRPEVGKGRIVSFLIKPDAGAAARPLFAHSQCLKYSANLFQNGDSTWDSKLVWKEKERTKRLPCTVCRISGKKGEPAGGAGCGCAFGKCRKNFHFPCIPITSKCRNEDAEDMYLAFCSTLCESKFFGTNSKILPLPGKRKVRTDTIEILALSEAKSKGKKTTTTTTTSTPKTRGRKRKVDEDLVKRGSNTSHDATLNDSFLSANEDTHDGSFVSASGTICRRSTNAFPILSRANNHNSDDESFVRDAADDEESMTSIDDQLMDAIDRMEDLDDGFPVGARKPVSDDKGAACVLAPALPDDKDGAAPEKATLAPQPKTVAVVEQLQAGPLLGQPPAGLPVAQPLAGLMLAQPLPGPMEACARPPPRDEGFESPDEEGTGPRAVCVKIGTRHSKVQHMAGFVFPPALMSGEVDASEISFDPRQEAVDLYQVVNELTNRNYRLFEFSPCDRSSFTCGNKVLDLLIPYLRRNQRVGGGADDVDEVVNFHVVHPRPQRDYFRHLVEESFSKLCDDLRAKSGASANPGGVSALILFPLFANEKAIIQPLYNGIVMPMAMCYGFVVSCLIGSRKEECTERRMEAWRECKWPTCALIKIVPKCAGN